MISIDNSCFSGKTDNAEEAFNACVVNLPAFFEFMSAAIDDLRRDIANFYVAQLSMALQSSGPSYLGQKLITRCVSNVLGNTQSETSDEANPSPDQLFPHTYTLLTSVLAPRVTPSTDSSERDLLVIKELNEHSGIIYSKSLGCLT